MARSWRVIILIFVLHASAVAQQVPFRQLTQAEQRLDLLAASHRADTTRATLTVGETEGKKSVVRAVAYSLILPGMGELYAGGFSSGRYFLGAEAGLWLTYAIFDVHGDALRDDARALAVSRAGLDPAGKDDQFFVDVGNFINTAEYNEKKLRDRQLDKVYNAAAGYGWNWDSDASRATYRDRRVASETMYNNRKFVAAAILINHVASAINAARAAIAHNNAAADPLGDLHLGASLLGYADAPHGVMVTVSTTF